MARECYICGKKPMSGRSISRRGMAKSKGGVGRRTTGKVLRKFKPNLQPVRIMEEGKKKKVKVCAKCLKSGKVKKAL